MPQADLPLDQGDAGQAPLDELRKRHWVAYLALRERIRLAAPDDLPGLHEQLARLQEEQQREEVVLTRPASPRAAFPAVPPPPHDINQEV